MIKKTRKIIGNIIYSIEWWLVERYDFSIIVHCDGCDKTRYNYTHYYLTSLCKKCYNNKCHVCEIECQEYEEHEMCKVTHQDCLDEVMSYD